MNKKKQQLKFFLTAPLKLHCTILAFATSMKAANTTKKIHDKATNPTIIGKTQVQQKKCIFYNLFKVFSSTPESTRNSNCIATAMKVPYSTSEICQVATKRTIFEQTPGEQNFKSSETTLNNTCNYHESCLQLK